MSVCKHLCVCVCVFAGRSVPVGGARRPGREESQGETARPARWKGKLAGAPAHNKTRRGKPEKRKRKKKKKKKKKTGRRSKRERGRWEEQAGPGKGGGVAERPPERGVSFSFLSLSLCCCLFFSSLFASRSTLHLCDSAGEQEEPSRPAGSKLLAGPREERTRERERERERRHTDRPSFSLHCGRFSRSTLSGR